MYYRRNSDEQLRGLERAWSQGDPAAFGNYVAAYVRAGTLPLNFLIAHPEAFEFLPQEWQDTLRQITGAPPPPPPPSQAELALAAAIADAEGRCGSCNAEIDEDQEITCEGVIEAEGETCGNTICSNCGIACPDCNIPLCDICFESPEAIEARTGRHRCEETAEECANQDPRSCLQTLYMQDQNESWCFISEEGAEMIEEEGMEATAGTMWCIQCLNDIDLEIGDVVEEEPSSPNSRYYY